MKRKTLKKINRSSFLFLFLIPMFSVVLIGRLFQLQVYDGNKYRQKADDSFVVSTSNSFQRGSIFFEDRNGELITAAGQQKGYKLSISPNKVVDPELLYEKINDVIPISNKEKFIQRTTRDSNYFEVLNKIPIEKGDPIRKILGNQVSLHSENWRVYPLQRAAAQTLGFLAFKGNDFAGRYGLERSYEKTLVRNSEELYTNFFARVFNSIENREQEEENIEGDLVTSIEPQVQIYLEKKVNEIQETYNSNSTGAIIMNPKTGSVYAMSSVPNFDPNDFSQGNNEIFKNPIIENIYEMGSTLKPLIVAMALDAGDIDESTSYFDTGSVVVGPHRIYNFDKKGRGLVDVQEILNQSLNTGMVHISKKINKQDFRDYFKKFGFGEKSGVDLPNDGKGLVSNLKSNRDIEFANMSFGQGIAISPISLIKASSALANNGQTVTPHLGTRIISNNSSKDIEIPEGVQVISPESSKEISRMLVNVFDSYNDGQSTIPNYSVAAKTGTAQIPAPDGGYYTDRNLHSFIGYFPAYNPEYIVMMYTVHPKGVKYASQTLLNPFRETTKFLINYYNIAPDR